MPMQRRGSNGVNGGLCGYARSMILIQGVQSHDLSLVSDMIPVVFFLFVVLSGVLYCVRAEM
jgi:hypothetical protein